MKTSASTLLPVIIVTICALGGCEWIAGIEDTTVGVDGMRPADAALPADASMTNRPDGGGGDELDGGGDSPDAAVDCPTECINDDAFEDFDAFQGGANGRWRYVEVQPETDSYVDMTFSAFPGAVAGWTGTGTPAPSLAFCFTNETMPPCLDLQGLLAMTTTAPGAHHPAVMWTAPYSGRYAVDVGFRTALDAPEVPATLMLAHNDQSNILHSELLGNNFLHARLDVLHSVPLSSCR